MNLRNCGLRLYLGLRADIVHAFVTRGNNYGAQH